MIVGKTRETSVGKMASEDHFGAIRHFLTCVLRGDNMEVYIYFENTCLLGLKNELCGLLCILFSAVFYLVILTHSIN